MIAETVYNEVFDSQRHFRTVLDAMAYPGKINRFAQVALTPPPGLHRAAAYVGFALLNADVTFHLAGFGEDARGYLQANTKSRSAGAAEADFVFIQGTGEPTPILEAQTGVPAYPDGGATVVIQVDHLGRSSSIGGTQLTLQGPGIATREIVFVRGLRPELIEALQTKNAEFPLGVDAMLVSADECVLCLPRSAKIRWATL